MTSWAATNKVVVVFDTLSIPVMFNVSENVPKPESLSFELYIISCLLIIRIRMMSKESKTVAQ